MRIHLKIGTATSNEALKQFIRVVVKHFKAEFLKNPTASELEQIAAE